MPGADQLLCVSELLHHIPDLRQSAPGVQQAAVLQAVDTELMQGDAGLVWLSIIDERMVRQAQPHTLRHRQRGQLHLHTPAGILRDEPLAV